MSRLSNFFSRAADLYVDGFRSMTVGKKLWLLIIIKVIIIFAILKVFFFPDILGTNYDTDTLIARMTTKDTRDDTTARATIDRLMEMCRGIALTGESWRGR